MVSAASSAARLRSADRIHILYAPVGCPALEYCGCAVPDPREAKACLADRKHRILQRREVPSLAAVSRDFNARDLAASAPGQPSDLVEANPRQLHLARRESDY